MKEVFDMNDKEFIRVSAKTGIGITELLDSIVERIPPPTVQPEEPLKAMIFDSQFVGGKGYRCSVFVTDGDLKKGQDVQLYTSDIICPVKEVGTFSPEPTECEELQAGQVGYALVNPKRLEDVRYLVGDLVDIICPVKEVGTFSPEPTECEELQAGQVGYALVNPKRLEDVRYLVGDTMFHTDTKRESIDAHSRVKSPQPMVFAGVFTDQLSELSSLASAIDKLCLNDSSVLVAKDSNHALGQGWRLGFLGVLHMEIFMQRLEQEFGASPVVTLPSVPYKVKLKYDKHIKENHGQDILDIQSPLKLPNHMHVAAYYEPFVQATIISPMHYLDTILELVSMRRSKGENVSSITDTRYMVTCKMPLAEVITDFNDALKRATSGLASFDYEDSGFEEADLVRIDFLVNKVLIEEFSMICHRDLMRTKSKHMIDKLVENIPKQQFEIKVQAVISDTSTVVAKGRLQAYRKDVFRKLHGAIGNERRSAMLKAQVEGKKKLRMVGNIQIPKTVFVEVFRTVSK
ncbi:translation factor Guf1, mitochondrial-like isoform X2 [Convolutriloba macropyga]